MTVLWRSRPRRERKSWRGSAVTAGEDRAVSLAESKNGAFSHAGDGHLRVVIMLWLSSSVSTILLRIVTGTFIRRRHLACATL